MPKRFPWIKLWFDALGDPKMRRLTIAERGCWDCILLLAGQSPIRGKLMLTPDVPMTLEDIALAIGLREDERPLLESAVEKLIYLDCLYWNEGALTVTHFKTRQEVYPSDFKDYHSDETPSKLQNNSSITPPKVLKEERGKKKEERSRREIQRKEAEAEEDAGSSTTSRIFTLYEQEIGLITPNIAEQIKDFLGQYRGPPEWIEQAFAEAARLNKRSWGYVEAILKQWQTEGKGKRQSRKTERQLPTTEELERGWK